jgi:TRAP-type mannitol/chloroaromatic compound transport system permease small subunit
VKMKQPSPVQNMQAHEGEYSSFCTTIDSLIDRLGIVVSWLNSILVVNIVVQVVLRYLLGEGKIWLEELEWHFYAVIIMVGLSYGLVSDTHVRLDIFNRKFSRVKKEYVDLFGLIFLVLPFFTIMFYHGLGFVATAWHVNESSPHPLGLPYWWIIKSLIPLTMFLVIMAALSRIVRAVAVIFRIRKEQGQR